MPRGDRVIEESSLVHCINIEEFDNTWKRIKEEPIITHNARLHSGTSGHRGSIPQLLYCAISEAGKQSFEEQSDALH